MKENVSSIKKTPVVGLVRYSQKIKFGNEKKERNVFEAEYFEYRFNIFKNVTLKSFQQQTNNYFVLLLFHSENMPFQYKDRFIELEKENPFLHNVFMEDTAEAFEEAIRNSIEYVSFEKNVAITFRIDNDDAVQNDFIERLSSFLKDDFWGYAISMPNVCRIEHISDTSYYIQEHHYPANSIGLAYVTNREQYKTIMEFGHHYFINKEIPLILIAEGAGGLLTINGENAANTINYENAKILHKEDLDKYLTKRKITNIDLDCLRILNTSSIFSLKKAIKLFVPSIFILLIRKMKKLI